MPDDPSPFAFSQIQPSSTSVEGPLMGGDTSQDDVRVLQEQLAKARDFQSRSMVANKAAENPMAGLSEMKLNTQTGEMSAKFHKDTFEALMRDHQELNQIRGSFHQEAERLKAQEERTRNQSPWITLATTLSANMAQQKNMPGWVQATGRTAAQLNPSADQIRDQRLGVMGEEAKLAESGMRLDMEKQQRDLGQTREDRLAATAQDAQTAKTFHELSTAAQKGELTDATITSQVLQNAGHPKDYADAQAKLLVGASKEKQTLIAAAEAATSKKAQDALNERIRESDQRTAVLVKGLALKASDKSDADKAVEAVAQSIAKGDLSSIRDITTFRSQERSKIYARAIEINPKFSVAETQRKIDMLKSFEVGKDSVGIQSFDTFVQHAGEVSETLKGIQMTNSPLLNKSLNWWRTNMKGTPELARLETSLEPVAMEFEKFLTNQQQVLKGDKERIDKVLDPKQPMNVILAATNQMVKTAKDRFGAMNYRYKRLMGQDIEHPFSEEAIASAKKLGIDLGSPGKKKPDDNDPLGVR